MYLGQVPSVDEVLATQDPEILAELKRQILAIPPRARNAEQTEFLLRFTALSREAAKAAAKARALAQVQARQVVAPAAIQLPRPTSKAGIDKRLLIAGGVGAVLLVALMARRKRR